MNMRQVNKVYQLEIRLARAGVKFHLLERQWLERQWAEQIKKLSSEERIELVRRREHQPELRGPYPNREGYVCMDKRHATPCPLPCAACEMECDPSARRRRPDGATV